jgi:hypothetical protein
MSTPPARNIAVTSKYPDSVFFRATCECCSTEHDHNIVVEVDDPKTSGDSITVSIFQDLEWAQYGDYKASRLSNLLTRVRNAFKYLVTGRVKVEGHFLMTYESARDYAAAIEQATQEIKKHTNRYDDK